MKIWFLGRELYNYYKDQLKENQIDMNYGFHRVIKPKGAVAQAALIIDNVPKILNPYEALLRVEFLNLDSTSMAELQKDYTDVGKRILEIVKERGKMHNPITNSGGVLLGEVEEIGGKLKDKFKLKPGDKIIPLVSLTAIPLYIDKVGKISGDQVEIEGKAILFESYKYSGVPKDMTPKMALSALDISSLVPQMKRLVKNNQTILVIGCGKAGLMAMSAVRKFALNCRVIGIDFSEAQLKIAKRLNLADDLIRVDATNAEEVFKIINKATKGKFCDLVVNCVNVANTETSSILAAKNRGKIIFFSMATQFNKAALGTDAAGKDVDMIIGNGISENQAEETFALLRENKKLRKIFEEIF